MVLALVLAALAVIAIVGAIITVVRDDRGRIPTLWGYDSRRPLP